MSGLECIDHPQHYGGADDPYEAIKVIEAWNLGFSLGSALKYIRRAGEKPGESTTSDLRKAAWYLNREADRFKHTGPTDAQLSAAYEQGLADGNP